MAFNSSTVSVGDFTKKSHFDQLLDNTQYNKTQHETLSGTVQTIQSSTATFTGEKTFQSSTIFNTAPQFTAAPGMVVDNANLITNLNADKIDGLHSTGLVQTTGAQTIAGVKTFSDGIDMGGGGQELKFKIITLSWTAGNTQSLSAHGLTWTNIRGLAPTSPIGHSGKVNLIFITTTNVGIVLDASEIDGPYTGYCIVFDV